MTIKKLTASSTHASASVIKLPGVFTLILSLLVAGCGSAGNDTSATDSDAAANTSSSTQSTVNNVSAIITPIVGSANDAEEEAATGSIDAASSDLELIYEPGGSGEQRVGLRFSLDIPKNSIVTRAYIQFTSDEVSTGESSLTIRAEYSANAASFSTNNFDISSRPVTTASVDWTPPEWNTTGESGIDQRTPDISTLAQKVVDLSDWQANNYIAFIITGTGTRTSVSHDGSPVFAPKLYIEYAVNEPEPEPIPPSPEPVTPPPAPVDHFPIAENDTLSTSENTAVSFNLLSNDHGLEDGGIVITLSSAPANGSTSLAQNGTVTYSPNGGYAGSDQFTYRVTDADGDSSSAIVNVTIDAINYLPIAHDDSIEINAGSSVTVNVLTNDTGLEDGGITVTLDNTPTNGSVQIDQNGTITYTPNSGYVGSDSLTYRITDSDGDSSSANFNLIIHPLISQQPASDDAEETMSTGRMDLASSNLELTLHTNGTGGQRVGLRFKLDVPSNSIITNAYIQFTTSQTSSGVSNLFIFAEKSTNAAAFASNDLNLFRRPASDITINWMPPDWNTIGQKEISQRTPDLSALIQEIITLDNWQASNHIAFTIYGSGTRIAYSLDSSLLNLGTTELAPQLYVEYAPADATSPLPAPTNTFPIAHLDSLTTIKNTPVSINVLSNDEGLSDAPINVTISTPAPNGRVVIGQNGNLTYTPDSDYLGTDTFTYTITDANSDADSASVNVSINDSNHLPVANADNVTTQTSTPVTIAVLDNDTGIEDSPITMAISTHPINGSVTIEPDNTITYTSNADYFGPDSFGYTITDIDNDSAAANVQITVTCTSGICSKTIRATWDANAEPNISGYYLHHGTQSGTYTDKIWVGDMTSYDFITSELTDHFFAVSAVNTSSDESDLSAEASISLAP